MIFLFSMIDNLSQSHQRFPFFFRDAGSADVLLHQPGEGAVVILGQYFRQLLVDGFFVFLHHFFNLSFTNTGLLSSTNSGKGGLAPSSKNLKASTSTYR